MVYQAPDGNPTHVSFFAGAPHGSADVRRLIAAGFTRDQAEAVVMVGRFPRTIDADKATVLATLADVKAQAAADTAARTLRILWWSLSALAIYSTVVGLLTLARLAGR